MVDQSERRVLNGESVAAGEKLVSLFEEHTAIIARGKAAKKTEFGRKVWLEEVEGGICSGYRILEGNPSDDKQLQPTLENHLRLFGRPPRLVAADRGVYSAHNERTILLGTRARNCSCGCSPEGSWCSTRLWEPPG